MPEDIRLVLGSKLKEFPSIAGIGEARLPSSREDGAKLSVCYDPPNQLHRQARLKSRPCRAAGKLGSRLARLG